LAGGREQAGCRLTSGGDAAMMIMIIIRAVVADDGGVTIISGMTVMIPEWPGAVLRF
jgi:hypothetical protein